LVSSEYRIRGTRKMRKMSGTVVAKRLGISPQYYYDLEKGTKSLSTEYALQLADIFNVSLEFLLGLPPQKEENLLSADMYADGYTDESVLEEWENKLKVASSLDTSPKWANNKDKRDFKKMLEDDAPVMFDGVPIEGEARQRVMDVLTGLFWEAKEMNKKTYSRKKNTTDNKE
jgi:transcriptional regulator with XRE-family HTH domain